MPEPRPDDVLKHHLEEFLQKRIPPKTFCPSEVARALSADELHQLGLDEWRDAMSSIRELAWQLRGSGQLEILQKGEPVSGEDPQAVNGPIRIRRTVG